MKPILKNTLTALGILIIIHQILFHTGIFKSYSIPSSSNVPTLPVGSHIILSNIAPCEIGDFIGYKLSNDIVYTHRLVGIPGDIIEIKEGVLFRNGKNFDQNINLNHQYFIDLDKEKHLVDNGNLDEKNAEMFRIKGGVIIMLSDEFVRQNNLEEYRMKRKAPSSSSEIQKAFNKNGALTTSAPWSSQTENISF
jgi:signal peptidase I